MGELGTGEEDLDDQVYVDEVLELEETTRWLAIGKVHMGKEYGDF